MRDFYRAGALGLRNLTYFQSFVLFCLGDLDGAEIDVDYAITPEQRLFLLGHLFGSHGRQGRIQKLLSGKCSDDSAEAGP